MDYSIEKEIFSHLKSIANNADRMTIANFMHHKAAIKLSAKIVTMRLQKLGLSSTQLIPSLWIARDDNGSLWLYNLEPDLGLSYKMFRQVDSDYSPLHLLDESLFSEVTFENSPKKVKLILCEP